MYWLMNLGVVGHRWENRCRLKCALGLFGSTTVCCYRRSVLENNVKGGSCDYGNSGISAVRICESGMPGMLGKNSCWQGWLGAI